MCSNLSTYFAKFANSASVGRRTSCSNALFTCDSLILVDFSHYFCYNRYFCRCFIRILLFFVHTQLTNTHTYSLRKFMSVFLFFVVFFCFFCLFTYIRFVIRLFRRLNTCYIVNTRLLITAHDN